jgi:hypothetical protein
VAWPVGCKPVSTSVCIHRYFTQVSVVCDGGGTECIAVHMELEILFCCVVYVCIKKCASTITCLSNLIGKKMPFTHFLLSCPTANNGVAKSAALLSLITRSSAQSRGTQKCVLSFDSSQRLFSAPLFLLRK